MFRIKYTKNVRIAAIDAYILCQVPFSLGDAPTLEQMRN